MLRTISLLKTLARATGGAASTGDNYISCISEESAPKNSVCTVCHQESAESWFRSESA